MESVERGEGGGVTGLTFAGREHQGVALLIRVEANDEGHTGMLGVNPLEQVHGTSETLWREYNETQL